MATVPNIKCSVFPVPMYEVEYIKLCRTQSCKKYGRCLNKNYFTVHMVRYCTNYCILEKNSEIEYNGF